MADESGAQVIEDDKKDIVVEDAAKTVEKSAELATSDNELEKIRGELERSRKQQQSLESQLQEERRGRTEANSRVVTETNNRLSAEEVAISNAIAASTSEAERLESEIVAAQENGKFSEAAKLTRQLASAQTKIDGWTNRKEQLETWKEQQKNRPAEVVDPNSHLSARTRAWIDRNPKFKTDENFRKKAQGYANLAESEGLAIDSDEYFEYVDSRINAKLGVEEPIVQQQVQRKTVASTPPSRNQGMGTTQQRETNRLTADEADMAKWTYPKLTPAEAQKKYYDGKLRAIAEGKIAGNA